MIGMSQRAMEPIGAAALVLSFINLLTATVKQMYEAWRRDKSSDKCKVITHQPIITVSTSTTTDINSTTSQSTTQVSPNISGVNSTGSESTTQGVLISHNSATNVTPTSNASIKTDITDNQTKNGFETSTRMNQSTEHYHPTATSSKLLTSVILNRQRTTNRTSSDTTITPRESYTAIPDIGITEKKTKDNTTAVPQIVDNVSGLQDNKEDASKNENDTANQLSLKKKKGIVIGVGCVLSVIVLVVLVFLYKMCQKKAPVSENTGVKGSAQNKDNVKLLSVKSATAPDAKRTSSNQMEFIEC